MLFARKCERYFEVGRLRVGALEITYLNESSCSFRGGTLACRCPRNYVFGTVFNVFF